MPLPDAILNCLSENARDKGVAPPKNDDDLFKTGTLDSFALVDFVTLVEEQCGIKVPDEDVIPSNFNTITAIESYVNGRRG